MPDPAPAVPQDELRHTPSRPGKGTAWLVTLAFLLGAVAPTHTLQAQAPPTTAATMDHPVPGATPGATPGAGVTPGAGAVPLRVSVETTMFTEPLYPDGTVNYIAALNHLRSQGVTKDNNAAVLLVQALDLGVEHVRSEDLRLLDVTLPKDHQYFQSYAQWWANRLLPPNRKPLTAKEAEDEFSTVYTGKFWTNQEHPDVAQWLAEQKEPLDLVVAASRREKFYLPYVTDEKNGEPSCLTQVLLPHLNAVRKVASALSCRALQRGATGDIDGAWQDTMAIYRLGRLVGQDGVLIEALVGYSLNGPVYHVARALAQRRDIDAAHRRTMLHDLANLPAIASLDRTLQIGERALALDTLQMWQRHGTLRATYPSFSQIPSAKIFSLTPSVDNAAADAPLVVDYNLVAPAINAEYDRVVKIAQMTSYPAQHQAAIDEQKKITALDQGVFTPDSQPLLIAYMQADVPTRLRMMTPMLTNFALRSILSGLESSLRTHWRGKVHMDLTQVVVALAAYRADHGAYPRELAQLAPDYLATVPPDRFTEQPFTYTHNGADVIVSSAGPSGEDEARLKQSDLWVELKN